MGIPRGQRKLLFVSRSIQGTVIGRFALYWIGYHFTLWHGMLLYGYFRGNLLQTVAFGGGMGFWEYYAGFYAANNTILLCAAAICPIFLWDTLRVTHRIAGPIVRFKKVLQQLSQGEEVKEIQLRDEDMLLDLRDAFNEFLASRKPSASAGDGKKSSADRKVLDNLLNQVTSESHQREETPVGSSV